MSEKKSSIVIAEGDAVLGSFLRDILVRGGYSAVCVRTPEAALAILGKEEVSLLIADSFGLSGEGLELCRNVRTRGLNVPLIFLAAVQDEELEETLAGLGAKIVPKPFWIEEFMDVVKELME